MYGRESIYDNTEVLLNHLIMEGYNKKYKIICLVKKSEHYTKYYAHNVSFVEGSLLSMYHIFTSRYIFHSFQMSISALRPCYRQVIFSLWHGSPLKTIGTAIKGGKKSWLHPFTDTYMLTASEFFRPINQRCYGYSDKQIFIGGNPRNDLLFTHKQSLKMMGIKKEAYKKVVIFMPTFRKSSRLRRMESAIEIPILSQDNIKIFNNYLQGKNILLIIKPHPAQDEISFLNKSYSHIKVYTNEDLKQKDVFLYEVLAETDGLLTDFSSVYFDYLLIQKPIGFIVDDIKDYGENRGFTVDNPLEIMPGPQITCYEEFVDFFENLYSEKDIYKEERKKVNELANAYRDNQNCERILKGIGIV